MSGQPIEPFSEEELDHAAEAICIGGRAGGEKFFVKRPLAGYVIALHTQVELDRCKAALVAERVKVLREAAAAVEQIPDIEPHDRMRNYGAFLALGRIEDLIRAAEEAANA